MDTDPQQPADRMLADPDSRTQVLPRDENPRDESDGVAPSGESLKPTTATSSAIELEAAVLGALMARPHLLDFAAACLRSADFRDPVHREAFTALMEARTEFNRTRGVGLSVPPGLLGPRSANQPRPASPQPRPPGAAAAPRPTEPDYPWLVEWSLRLHRVRWDDRQRLRGACPDAQRAHVYVRMLLVDRLRVQAAATATRLAATAAAAAAGEATLSDAVAELDAVTGTMADLSACWSTRGWPARRPADVAEGAVPADGDTSSADSSDLGADQTAEREDRVLAGLVQHPRQLPVVAAWLVPADFTAPGRRGLYAGMLALFRRRDPLDRVTLQWEARRRQALDDHGAGAAAPFEAWRADAVEEEVAPRHARRLTLDEVAALATAPVSPGTAVELGRDVLRASVLAILRRRGSDLAILANSALPTDDFLKMAGVHADGLRTARVRLRAAGLDPTPPPVRRPADRVRATYPPRTAPSRPIRPRGRTVRRATA